MLGERSAERVNQSNGSRPRRLDTGVGTLELAIQLRSGARGAGRAPRCMAVARRSLSAESLAWLVGYRRLQVRYERRAGLLLGFLQLACTRICRNQFDTQALRRAVGAGVRGSVPLSRRP
jgi:hypothetical protein